MSNPCRVKSRKRSSSSCHGKRLGRMMVSYKNPDAFPSASLYNQRERAHGDSAEEYKSRKERSMETVEWDP